MRRVLDSPHFLLAITLSVASCASAQAHPGFRASISAKPDQWGLYNVDLLNRSKTFISAVWLFRDCSSVSGADGGSGRSGFDSLEGPSFDRYGSPVAPTLHPAPGVSETFSFPTGDERCPTGISVLFANGHGEGSENPTFGWQAMIRHRLAYYSELQHCQEILRGLPQSSPDFQALLLDRLDARRRQLADTRSPDFTHEEAESRSQVLAFLLLPLRDRSRAEPWIRDRDTALKHVADWAQPLAEWVKKTSPAGN